MLCGVTSIISTKVLAERFVATYTYAHAKVNHCTCALNSIDTRDSHATSHAYHFC